MSSQPLQFLLLLFAGWVNRQQLDVIEYLKDKILREQLGGRPIRLHSALPSKHLDRVMAPHGVSRYGL